MSIQFPEPARISRLQLPERKAEIGMSLREGERVLEVNASKHQNLVDLTYADTKRFPGIRLDVLQQIRSNLSIR